jgi:hypothetical protein
MSTEPAAWGRNPFSMETGRNSLSCRPFILIVGTLFVVNIKEIKKRGILSPQPI